MITLAGFGPAFGLTDPSPFVTKVEILLKMAGLAYVKDTSFGAFRRAPKGKLPYIVDDGVIIADSTFIRLHLQHKFGLDFDAGLSSEQRATGWAFDKLAEDHLYWITLHARWRDPANLALIRKHFADMMPPVIGPLLMIKASREVRRHLRSQGIGRHSPEEINELGRRDLIAISDMLADKPFFFGPEPKGVDATLGAFVVGTLCEAFESPLRKVAEDRRNLLAYRDRIVARFLQAPRPERATA